MVAGLPKSRVKGYIAYLNNSLVNLIGENNKRNILGKKIHNYVDLDYDEILGKNLNNYNINNTGFIKTKLKKVNKKLVNVEIVSIDIRYKKEDAILYIIQYLPNKDKVDNKDYIYSGDQLTGLPNS